MPTFPEQNNETQSSGMGCSFTANVPIVTSLSSRELVKQGWERVGDTFHKDGNTITYNGATWKFNGQPVQFFEDLK